MKMIPLIMALLFVCYLPCSSTSTEDNRSQAYRQYIIALGTRQSGPAVCANGSKLLNSTGIYACGSDFCSNEASKPRRKQSFPTDINLEYHFGNNNCGKYQPIPVNNDVEQTFINVYNTSYKIMCFDRLTVVYPGQSYEGSMFKLMVETNDTSSKQVILSVFGATLLLEDGRLVVEHKDEGTKQWIRTVLKNSNVKRKRWFMLHLRFQAHSYLNKMTLQIYKDGIFIEPFIMFDALHVSMFTFEMSPSMARKRRAILEKSENRRKKRSEQSGDDDDDDDDDDEEEDDTTEKPDSDETTTIDTTTAYFTPTLPDVYFTSTIPPPPPKLRLDNVEMSGDTGPKGQTGAKGFPRMTDPPMKDVTLDTNVNNRDRYVEFKIYQYLYIGAEYSRIESMDCIEHTSKICVGVGQDMFIRRNRNRDYSDNELPKCAKHVKEVIQLLCAEQFSVCKRDGTSYGRPCKSVCEAAKKALDLEKCKFDLFCDDLPNGADCYEYGKPSEFLEFKGQIKDGVEFIHGHFLTDKSIMEAFQEFRSIEPYIKNQCECDGKYTPAIDPSDTIKCVSHVYDNLHENRVGYGGIVSVIQYANDGDKSTSYYTKYGLVAQGHGVEVMLKPNSKIYKIDILMTSEFPSGYMLVKVNTGPSESAMFGRRKRAALATKFTVQNVSRHCDNEPSPMRNMLDYSCITVADEIGPGETSNRFTITINMYEDRSHIIQESHRAVRASEVVSPPDIFSPNSVSLQFYNGKKTDYSIGIAEITILNDNNCGCNIPGTIAMDGCDIDGVCVCKDIGMRVDTRKAGIKCDSYIDSIFPTKGPIAGGTLITIRGAFYGLKDKYDVDVSTSITGLRFYIVSVNENSIRLMTLPSVSIIERSIHFIVKFNGGPPLISTQTFTILPNPQITEIYPRQSFLIGGIKQYLRGTNMDSVVLPEMTTDLYYGDMQTSYLSEKSVCKTINSTSAECKVPFFKKLINLQIENITLLLEGKISEEDIFNLRNTSNVLLHNAAINKVMKNTSSIVSVKMDGVMKPFALNVNRSITLILTTPDIFEFQGDYHQIDSSLPLRNRYSIPINGANLQPGSMKEDYIIKIGSSTCVVTRLFRNKVFCNAVQTQSLTNVTDANPILTVKLGPIDFYVGAVKYPLIVPLEGSNTGLIIGLVLGILAALVLLIVLYLLYRRRQQKKLLYDHEIEMNNKFKHENDYMTAQDDYMTTLDKETYTILQNLLIPVEKITFDSESRLGSDDDTSSVKSNFCCIKQLLSPVAHARYLFIQPHSPLCFYGIVMKGDYLGNEIAMKTLKHEKQMQKTDKGVEEVNVPHTCIEIKEFIQEGLIMKDFDHENVMNLIGIVNIDENNLGKMPYVIMPLMHNGDLKSFVMDHKNFTKNDLLEFGYQVAKGMQYLSSRRFVHRDLACRNCMVDDKWIVKIADFGLSRDVYTSEYYRRKTIERKLPLPIMALEVLNNTGSHTVKSDVWSYGVLLWELWTNMKSPYENISMDHILDYLSSGQRLAKPSIAPDSIYGLMHECWMSNPDLRPSFEEIVSRSKRLLADDISCDDKYYIIPSEREYMIPEKVDLVRGYISPGYVNERSQYSAEDPEKPLLHSIPNSPSNNVEPPSYIEVHNDTSAQLAQESGYLIPTTAEHDGPNSSYEDNRTLSETPPRDVMNPSTAAPQQRVDVEPPYLIPQSSDQATNSPVNLPHLPPPPHDTTEKPPTPSRKPPTPSRKPPTLPKTKPPTLPKTKAPSRQETIDVNSPPASFWAYQNNDDKRPVLSKQSNVKEMVKEDSVDGYLDLMSPEY